jgi:uncharacterized protein YbjQ (UPF0145 family)
VPPRNIIAATLINRQPDPMIRRIPSISAAVLAAALAGCASIKAEDVRVYSPAELTQNQYETVARLWVGTWRKAFWVPTYSSEDDGVAALRDKAAGLGANGLINVACYAGGGQFFVGSDATICYGKAIKVP